MRSAIFAFWTELVSLVLLGAGRFRLLSAKVIHLRRFVLTRNGPR
jgi:hypothetical protein